MGEEYDIQAEYDRSIRRCYGIMLMIAYLTFMVSTSMLFS